MHIRSFKTMFAITSLFFFLATPLSAFAAFTNRDLQRLLILQSLEQSGNLTPQQSAELQNLVIAQSIFQNQQAQRGQGINGGGSGLQALGLLGAIGGLGGLGGQGAGGQGGGINPAMLGLAMMGGGGLFGGGAGGGGPLGQIGQGLALGGMLGGNMGLAMIGMIMSMLGSLGGGATPQKTAVDEQYVRQGQAGPYGTGGIASNPYYPTPIPVAPTATPVPSASCPQSIFIVKDTTVTPNTVKPYASTVSIAKDECVLAINSDTASHGVQAKQQGQARVISDEAIAGQQSHIFRFAQSNTYTLCVDASASACTTVTVQ